MEHIYHLLSDNIFEISRLVEVYTLSDISITSRTNQSLLFQPRSFHMSIKLNQSIVNKFHRIENIIISNTELSKIRDFNKFKNIKSITSIDYLNDYNFGNYTNVVKIVTSKNINISAFINLTYLKINLRCDLNYDKSFREITNEFNLMELILVDVDISNLNFQYFPRLTKLKLNPYVVLQPYLLKNIILLTNLMNFGYRDVIWKENFRCPKLTCLRIKKYDNFIPIDTMHEIKIFEIHTNDSLKYLNFMIHLEKLTIMSENIRKISLIHLTKLTDLVLYCYHNTCLKKLFIPLCLKYFILKLNTSNNFPIYVMKKLTQLERFNLKAKKKNFDVFANTSLTKLVYNARYNSSSKLNNSKIISTNIESRCDRKY